MYEKRTDEVSHVAQESEFCMSVRESSGNGGRSLGRLLCHNADNKWTI